MQRIVIKYSISRTVALTEGRTEYGEATYEPTDTELQFLDLETRKYLDGLNLAQTTFALPASMPPVWPTIADAIKAARQKDLDKQAAELAEREVHILECLAEPDEKWINDSRDWQGRRSVGYNIPEYRVRNNHWGFEDPRIVARIEALRPEFERRQTEAKQQNAEREAQRQAEAEAREQAKALEAQAKQDAIAELTAWCIEQGPEHLKRAAVEQYDVTGGCVQWLAECLRDELAPLSATIVRENTKLWNRYDWNERKSPGSKAFDMLDVVKAAASELRHPESVTVEIERIMLVTLEPAEDSYDDPKQEFTGVVVNVLHPAAAQRCLVLEVK